MAAQLPQSTRRQPDQMLEVQFREPNVSDGPDLWRLAQEAEGLGSNSPYSYLLWCRDFPELSVVAHTEEGACGFVTGYMRPGWPDTVCVWQVVVGRSFHRQDLGRWMLDYLADQVVARGCQYMETIVAVGDSASSALLTSLAQGCGGELTRSVVFAPEHLLDDCEREVLLRIGPIPRQ